MLKRWCLVWFLILGFLLSAKSFAADYPYLGYLSLSTPMVLRDGEVVLAEDGETMYELQLAGAHPVPNTWLSTLGEVRSVDVDEAYEIGVNGDMSFIDDRDSALEQRYGLAEGYPYNDYEDDEGLDGYEVYD